MLTALPPTKGHLRLLQFSAQLGDPVTAIVCTQPQEPFAWERYIALRLAAPAGVTVYRLHENIEQNPEAEGFWDMWRNIFLNYGWRPGDRIVASEPYGKTLAAELGGEFFPYDIDREILFTKGASVRTDPWGNFSQILPEFQPELRKTVTFIGAESTGKTTLSKHVAMMMNLPHAPGAWWLMEWARPYLESLDDKTITYKAMADIHKGQLALQRQGQTFLDRPVVIQDTDLFATVGYWGFWKPGECPRELIDDAYALKSDLYIIPRSNIPFEADPIRYGDGVRESADQYWIDLMEQYGLNYVVLDSQDLPGRSGEVMKIIREKVLNPVHASLRFDREYAGVGTRY